LISLWTIPISYSCPIIIIIIILVLGSTNEWEHAIFGFLGLSYLTQHMISSFFHFPANDTIMFFFMTEYYSMVICVLYILSTWWLLDTLTNFTI
jgi:hypothetical protein